MQLKPAYPLENGRLLISCRPSARFQCQLCPVIISDLLRLFSDWATTMNHAWARVPMSRSRELDIISTKPLCMKDPSTNINFEYVRIQSMTIRDSQVESQRAVYLYICLSICLSAYLPIYLSTSLPLYLSTSLPIYLSTYLPNYLSIYLSS
jgi:hypothetical protein